MKCIDTKDAIVFIKISIKNKTKLIVPSFLSLSIVIFSLSFSLYFFGKYSRYECCEIEQGRIINFISDSV